MLPQLHASQSIAITPASSWPAYLQLVGEVEKKAVLFHEQQQEHARVQSAYNSMGQAVEAASQEKRAAQAQLRSWEQQTRRNAKQQK